MCGRQQVLPEIVDRRVEAATLLCRTCVCLLHMVPEALNVDGSVRCDDRMGGHIDDVSGRCFEIGLRLSSGRDVLRYR